MKLRLAMLLTCVLAGTGRAAAADQTLSDVFKRVNPAVVEIHTKETEVAAGRTARQVSVAGLGSGVLISPDGKILTAAHVVQTAEAIEVEFLTGEKLRARVVSSEPAADVALLQLEKAPRVPFVAKIGDSDAVEIGEQVFVVGAPLGVSHTLTVGFAITSKVARQLMLEEKSFWSGVNGYMVTGALAQVFNVPPPGVGLLVQRVAPGSPAEQIGLKGGTIRATIEEEDLIVGGDIVLAIQGISLAAPNGLVIARQILTELNPGDPATVTVLRGGKTTTLTASRQP